MSRLQDLSNQARTTRVGLLHEVSGQYGGRFGLIYLITSPDSQNPEQAWVPMHLLNATHERHLGCPVHLIAKEVYDIALEEFKELKQRQTRELLAQQELLPLGEPLIVEDALLQFEVTFMREGVSVATEAILLPMALCKFQNNAWYAPRGLLASLIFDLKNRLELPAESLGYVAQIDAAKVNL